MKGQSAVEYIMTYGWAILALVLVTAALVASGVLSPNYLISEECNLGSNFPCNFIVYNEAGETHLSLDVYNGFPYEIEVTGITIEMKDTGDVFTGLSSGIGRIESGGKRNFQGTFTGPELTKEAIKRFSASITYVSCAPEVSEGTSCSDSEHTISGKIVARIASE